MNDPSPPVDMFAFLVDPNAEDPSQSDMPGGDMGMEMGTSISDKLLGDTLTPLVQDESVTMASVLQLEDVTAGVETHQAPLGMPETIDSNVALLGGGDIGEIPEPVSAMPDQTTELLEKDVPPESSTAEDKVQEVADKVDSDKEADQGEGNTKMPQAEQAEKEKDIPLPETPSNEDGCFLGKIESVYSLQGEQSENIKDLWKWSPVKPDMASSKQDQSQVQRSESSDKDMGMRIISYVVKDSADQNQSQTYYRKILQHEPGKTGHKQLIHVTTQPPSPSVPSVKQKAKVLIKGKLSGDLVPLLNGKNSSRKENLTRVPSGYRSILPGVKKGGVQKQKTRLKGVSSKTKSHLKQFIEDKDPKLINEPVVKVKRMGGSQEKKGGQLKSRPRVTQGKSPSRPKSVAAPVPVGLFTNMWLTPDNVPEVNLEVDEDDDDDEYDDVPVGEIEDGLDSMTSEGEEGEEEEDELEEEEEEESEYYSEDEEEDYDDELFLPIPRAVSTTKSGKRTTPSQKQTVSVSKKGPGQKRIAFVKPSGKSQLERRCTTKERQEIGRGNTKFQSSFGEEVELRDCVVALSPINLSSDDLYKRKSGVSLSKAAREALESLSSKTISKSFYRKKKVTTPRSNLGVPSTTPASSRPQRVRQISKFLRDDYEFDLAGSDLSRNIKEESRSPAKFTTTVTKKVKSPSSNKVSRKRMPESIVTSDKIIIPRRKGRPEKKVLKKKIVMLESPIKIKQSSETATYVKTTPKKSDGSKQCITKVIIPDQGGRKGFEKIIIPTQVKLAMQKTEGLKKMASKGQRTEIVRENLKQKTKFSGSAVKDIQDLQLPKKRKSKAPKPSEDLVYYDIADMDEDSMLFGGDEERDFSETEDYEDDRDMDWDPRGDENKFNVNSFPQDDILSSFIKKDIAVKRKATPASGNASKKAKLNTPKSTLKVKPKPGNFKILPDKSTPKSDQDKPRITIQSTPGVGKKSPRTPAVTLSVVKDKAIIKTADGQEIEILASPKFKTLASPGPEIGAEVATPKAAESDQSDPTKTGNEAERKIVDGAVSSSQNETLVASSVMQKDGTVVNVIVPPSKPPRTDVTESLVSVTKETKSSISTDVSESNKEDANVTKILETSVLPAADIVEPTLQDAEKILTKDVIKDHPPVTTESSFLISDTKTSAVAIPESTPKRRGAPPKAKLALAAKGPSNVSQASTVITLKTHTPRAKTVRKTIQPKVKIEQKPTDKSSPATGAKKREPIPILLPDIGPNVKPLEKPQSEKFVDAFFKFVNDLAEEEASQREPVLKGQPFSPLMSTEIRSVGRRSTPNTTRYVMHGDAIQQASGINQETNLAVKTLAEDGGIDSSLTMEDMTGNLSILSSELTKPQDKYITSVQQSLSPGDQQVRNVMYQPGPGRPPAGSQQSNIRVMYPSAGRGRTIPTGAGGQTVVKTVYKPHVGRGRGRGSRTTTADTRGQKAGSKPVTKYYLVKTDTGNVLIPIRVGQRGTESETITAGAQSPYIKQDVPTKRVLGPSKTAKTSTSKPGQRQMRYALIHTDEGTALIPLDDDPNKPPGSTDQNAALTAALEAQLGTTVSSGYTTTQQSALETSSAASMLQLGMESVKSETVPIQDSVFPQSEQSMVSALGRETRAADLVSLAEAAQSLERQAEAPPAPVAPPAEEETRYALVQSEKGPLLVPVNIDGTGDLSAGIPVTDEIIKQFGLSSDLLGGLKEEPVVNTEPATQEMIAPDPVETVDSSQPGIVGLDSTPTQPEPVPETTVSYVTPDGIPVPAEVAQAHFEAAPEVAEEQQQQEAPADDQGSRYALIHLDTGPVLVPLRPDGTADTSSGIPVTEEVLNQLGLDPSLLQPPVAAPEGEPKEEPTAMPQEATTLPEAEIPQEVATGMETTEAALVGEGYQPSGDVMSQAQTHQFEEHAVLPEQAVETEHQEQPLQQFPLKEEQVEQVADETFRSLAETAMEISQEPQEVHPPQEAAETLQNLAETAMEVSQDSSEQPEEMQQILPEQPVELQASLPEQPEEMQPTLTEQPVELQASLPQQPEEMQQILPEQPEEMQPTLTEIEETAEHNEEQVLPMVEPDATTETVSELEVTQVAEPVTGTEATSAVDTAEEVPEVQSVPVVEEAIPEVSEATESMESVETTIEAAIPNEASEQLPSPNSLTTTGVPDMMEVVTSAETSEEQQELTIEVPVGTTDDMDGVPVSIEAHTSSSTVTEEVAVSLDQQQPDSTAIEQPVQAGEETGEEETRYALLNTDTGPLLVPMKPDGSTDLSEGIPVTEELLKQLGLSMDQTQLGLAESGAEEAAVSTIEDNSVTTSESVEQTDMGVSVSAESSIMTSAALESAPVQDLAMDIASPGGSSLATQSIPISTDNAAQEQTVTYVTGSESIDVPVPGEPGNSVISIPLPEGSSTATEEQNYYVVYYDNN